MVGLIEKPWSSAFWETKRPLKVSGLAQAVFRPKGVCRPMPKTMRSLKRLRVIHGGRDEQPGVARSP